MRRRGAWFGLGLVSLIALPVLRYANLFDASAPNALTREMLPVEPRAPGDRRVVLVSIDGLAPRLLTNETSPNLVRLARDGLSARRAETVVPSLTLPSHTSMLSGLPPEEYGVLWNRWEPWRRFRVQTVFSVCAEQGLRCGLFAAKPKLAHLAADEPGVERFGLPVASGAVFDAALRYARERDPDLLVVHVGEVDSTGHASGWDSPAQREALALVDAELARFVDALAGSGSGRLALLVTSDHGGHGRRHGSAAPEDVRIPWILWGEGIGPGIVEEPVSTLDTASTLLALLGREAPGGWRGTSRWRHSASSAARRVR